MTDPLYVSEQDPVVLDGTIDAASTLQMVHSSDSLDDYDQKLHAEHRDLNSPSGIIRCKLMDFSSGGDNWEITATHDPGSGSVTWSRGTDHAYYDFGPTSTELPVEITATSDASPPATKRRTIKVKTSPLDAQPDRPRR
ncbi:hypothetical protein ENSA5_18960 [Enhygromyxa salina]|uniref:Uncharacterized protein n=1 Tax=Enhygromyxa salina TaxID=215803 RepID=A0A2S9YCW3_9BACT|nr:hypothetical protein [Enhygromyxa salina]PRQ02957.1 hypothetical protein ENSA5_18960 [Enhygromyxa salina]